MNKKINLVLGALVTLLSLTGTSFATKVMVVEAQDAILSFTSTLENMKNHVTIPVLFPATIPKGEQAHYYIGSEFFHDKKNQQYTFYINATADCKNAHYCNIGIVSGETHQKPVHYKDKQGTVITTEVSLINNITGYYTPGHAMGSYFPAMMQWVHDDILYTVKWRYGVNDEVEKNILTTLAVTMLMEPSVQ